MLLRSYSNIKVLTLVLNFFIISSLMLVIYIFFRLVQYSNSSLVDF